MTISFWKDNYKDTNRFSSDRLWPVAVSSEGRLKVEGSPLRSATIDPTLPPAQSYVASAALIDSSARPSSVYAIIEIETAFCNA